MPSQVIRDFAYDADRHELTVNFTSGKAYIYSLVPAAVADAFGQAGSPGGYFNVHIRDRYPFRKTKAEPAEAMSLREALRASR
jgi:lysyl-tRNA synthetase class 2